MRKILAFLLIVSITSLQSFAGAGVGSANSAVAVTQDEGQWEVSFTPEQLENLLAPIALYPDPLLAQVLLAATFPDQVDQAARTMRAYNNRFDIDSTDWDVSVKAVAHYPTVLSMMADKIDWTTSVGQAYANQSSDVMDAIQRLRQQARSMGNLVTTPQEQIVETNGYLYIYPAQPQYIYVPTYDQAVVYFRRPALFWGPTIVFSMGFAIGVWLNHDCDWDHRRVFYHGWERGPAWMERSRPFIRVNNIYVNRRYEHVIINRGVLDHHVNYGALDRYHAIHRDTNFGDVRHERGVVGERRPPQPGPIQQHPDNQIIRRNLDPNDPRINANRGHGGMPQPEVNRNFPRPGDRTIQPPPQPEVNRNFPRPDGRTVQPTPQPEVNRNFPRPDGRTVQPLPPQSQPDVGRNFPRPQGRTDQPLPSPAPQGQPQWRGNKQSSQPPSSVFGGNAGAIDSRDASRRGQMSRQQEYRPPAVNAAPPGKPQGPPRGGGGRPHK